ncbi:hypothetical protein VTN77DRAFT_780 [Rasamsonia byssochlamydoides]|uniref:uncharacterized protein n=1 Tax=Rasamsonia byssochlamydoides TaxID=89139 RepID=UPI003742F417
MCKGRNNSYCYLEQVEDYDSDIGCTNSPNFSCPDSCMIRFYTNAHEYNISGGSSKQFSYYYLVGVGDRWNRNFQQGWNTVL